MPTFNSSNLFTVQQPNCLDYKSIIRHRGEIVENADGTVSVFMPNFVDKLTPVILTETCCKAIKSSYVWDNNKQQCLWSPTASCTLNDVFKIILNPKGNDGVLFYVDPNENCSLTIDFDYLFKIKCETIVDVLNSNINNPINQQTQAQINSLTLQIQNQTLLCSSLQNKINNLAVTIQNTPYSIVCFSSSQNGNRINMTGVTSDPFKRTAFGKLSAPFSFPKISPVIGKYYCLTDEGLLYWENLIGNVNYNKFLNADISSYTCTDVDTIFNQNYNNTISNPRGPTLINTCNIPFGTKTQYINQLSSLVSQQTVCNDTLIKLQDDLNSLVGNLNNGICVSPINIFELLDVSITLDVISGNTLQTVYEYNLFPKIGVGKLYNYLTSNLNSGFYVCGDPTATETGFTSCTTLTVNFSATPTPNVHSCDVAMNSLLSDLFLESGLSGTSSGLFNFQNTISENAFKSQWLHYHDNITDSNILKTIANQKIKVSLKVNHTCSDFCILIDEIVLDKVCTETIKNSLFLSQSPRFELNKVIDNKKSWVNNSIPDTRQFVISNNQGGNSIRQTNYNLNDERLIINTKEIDLDISIASAIETDVWCYLTNNQSLLTGKCETDLIITTSGYSPSLTWLSGTTLQYFIDGSPITSAINVVGVEVDSDIQYAIDSDVTYINSGAIISISGNITTFLSTIQKPSGQTANNATVIWSQPSPLYTTSATSLFDCGFCSGSCGDVNIDFTSMLTQPLSAITTVEGFEYYITSELIDAKNRQTLSGYPTIKAIYNRYLNSSSFTQTNSSAFNYFSIDQFAKLIDNYWVDIVEQVVPSTTIWGSVKIYSNTLFDQQKFKYRKYSTLFCGNPFSGQTILSPINSNSGTCVNVDVSMTPLILQSSINGKFGLLTTYCDSICISQMNIGSEFIGSVNVISNSGGGKGNKTIKTGHGSFVIIEKLP